MPCHVRPGSTPRRRPDRGHSPQEYAQPQEALCKSDPDIACVTPLRTLFGSCGLLRGQNPHLPHNSGSVIIVQIA
jgi:hypothetical protein